MALSDILHIASSTLEALKFMHAREYIHCDVKLRNIILTQGGGIKLADFGAARKYPYDGGETGTLYFNAPELIRSNWSSERFGPGVDIYAFGITLIGKSRNIYWNFNYFHTFPQSYLMAQYQTYICPEKHLSRQ